MVKKFGCFWLVLFTPCFAFAQEITNLTLQQAYDLAYKNYPVWRQKDLVRRTADLNIDILQKDRSHRRVQCLPGIDRNPRATSRHQQRKTIRHLRHNPF